MKQMWRTAWSRAHFETLLRSFFKFQRRHETERLLFFFFETERQGTSAKVSI